ncbi:MAG: UDP-N-acetylmuramoyl-L-alanine--D-glutamate ligase [Planctomycetota bacterium]|jgi:UDP-N-acetylmuramoylalanine--D-glutamate ligase
MGIDTGFQLMALGKKKAKVTVMGLGTFGGGTGAVRFWANLGADITVTDLCSEEELQTSISEISDLNCKLTLGRHEENDFSKSDIIVVNPAVKPGNKYIDIARESGAKIVTEIGTLLQILQGPIFGITGSNGKSTTTALLGNILQKLNPDTLTGGNIGGSLLAEIEQYPPTVPAVIELSSFQLYYLAEQKKSVDYAVITNLSPNHLDWHGDIDNYYNAKRNILNFQWPEDCAILNNDDPVLRKWAAECPQRVALFGREDPDCPNAAFIKDHKIVIRVAGKEAESFNISGLNLNGEHNVSNAMAASLAAAMYVKQHGIIKEGIRTFKGLPHRMEFVHEKDGIKFYNDSVATTPESTIAALNTLECPVVIIAGGYDKKISLTEMSKELAKKAAGTVLIGQTKETIKKEMLNENKDAKTKEAENLEEAVKTALTLCPDQGAIILSPGCASYDMFKNFEQRGMEFKKIVMEL